MTLKKNLADVGYYLITPLPKKYHFEGVDNARIARNLGLYALGLQVVTVGFVFYGPVVVESAVILKNKVKNRLKKK